LVDALQMVQNRVAEISDDLPGDLQLQIERMTPETFPVFILGLTGALPTPDLYDYARFVMRPEIARLPGAGIIDVQASDTREIEVVLDPAKLAAADLTVLEVSDALKAQNTVMPVGRFQESGLQHLTLASGLWKTTDDIARAPVKVVNGATLRVSDLGTVTRGAPDRTRLVTGGGREAVVMTIAQQIGANVLDLQRGLDTVLDNLTKTLPAGLRITRVYDLAEFVAESIASVRDAILIGGLLAIVVLLAFLRDWRLTLIAAVTLPMAVVPTFTFMWLFGGTINLMSMGRTRRRHRSRHRRCGGGRRKRAPARGRGGDERCRRRTAVARAPDQLDADDGRRLRSARAALGRAGTVLSRIVTQPLGRSADVAGVVRKRRPADVAVGGAASASDR
jgi:multidrug efflux pump subunit AcrB